MIAQPAQALVLREPPAPRKRDAVRRGGLAFASGQKVAPQFATDRRSTPAHRAADLTTRFPGRMQPGNLNTIIKIELVISLAHRNSGLHRCCASFVNSGSTAIQALPHPYKGATVARACVKRRTPPQNDTNRQKGIFNKSLTRFCFYGSLAEHGRMIRIQFDRCRRNP
jgi:hypothetical protein